MEHKGYRGLARKRPGLFSDVSARLLTGALGEEEILLRDSRGLLVKRLMGEKVIRLEDGRNRIILESGREIRYDRLLIASGASPAIPPLKGMSKEGSPMRTNKGVSMRKLSFVITDWTVIRRSAYPIKSA